MKREESTVYSSKSASFISDPFCEGMSVTMKRSWSALKGIPLGSLDYLIHQYLIKQEENPQDKAKIMSEFCGKALALPDWQIQDFPIRLGLVGTYASPQRQNVRSLLVSILCQTKRSFWQTSLCLSSIH